MTDRTENGVRIDERAVTPVIGVILVVALAVVLSAFVGGFALGLFDESTETAPQTTLEWDYDAGSDELTIRHGTGDAFEKSKIRVEVERSDGTVDDITADCTSEWPDEVSSSDECTVSPVGSDETVTVYWDGEEVSTELGSFSPA